jgi:hypothetical protein
MEIRKYFELNDNENISYQNLWDTVKPVLKETETQSFTSGGSHQVGQDGCIQLHPGAVEEEAVGPDVLSAKGVMLAVPPALSAAQGSLSYLANIVRCLGYKAK